MDPREIIAAVQVNIPFRMLEEGLLQTFLHQGLNPEIGLDGETLDNLDTGAFRRAVEAFRDAGRTITLHSPFLDLSPGSLDPAVRRVTRTRLEQTLRLVPAANPLTVVCHTGWDHRRYLEIKSRWLEESWKMWEWFAGALRDAGTRLMLENVYERSPREFLEIYGPIRESGAGFCLDTGHQSAFGEADLEEWVSVLGREVGQLHLHDNHGQRDEHLAPGQGDVDFRMLFRELGELAPVRPVVTLEPHKEEDLWKALEFLARTNPWQSPSGTGGRP